MPDWSELSARASKASHRLIGWIYWDPDAIAAYAALGVPDGTGWYIASRSAPLAAAGHQAVAAAFYSIHPGFIEGSLALAAAATTWEQITDVRDAAVAAGLDADDDALAEAIDGLEARGLAADGRVNAAGIARRERIEERTDTLCELPWRTFGEANTRRLLDLIEPVGPRFMARVDATTGPEWMPAARDRR